MCGLGMLSHCRCGVCNVALVLSFWFGFSVVVQGKGVSVISHSHVSTSSSVSCSACTCAMASTTAACNVAWNVNMKCYSRIRTLNAAGTCGYAGDSSALDQVRPSNGGVYERRADCCSAWNVVPFSDIAGEYLVLGEDTVIYHKNHSTVRWEPNDALPLPPTYDFPGLSAVMTVGRSGYSLYDNTTCKHRCCVLGLVNRANYIASSDACKADWTQCVDTGFDSVSGNAGGPYPACGVATSAPMCTVWVPCSSSQRWVIEPGIVVVVLVAASVAAVWYRQYRAKWEIAPVETVYMVLGFLSSVALIFTLISACRYINWVESTGVDREYISYQACVAECNSRQNSVDDFFHRFCTEAYNATRLARWVIWEEDYNMLVDSNGPGMCDPGSYCSQCASKMDEFDVMLRLAQFLRVKAYLSWLAFCLVVAGSQLVVWVIGAVFHASFWITASVFFGMVHDMASTINQLDKGYSSMGSDLVFPSLVNMCVVCIALDLFFFLVLLWMLGCDSGLRTLRVKPSQIPPPSDVFGVRIEPKYTKLPISLSTFL